jgi:hypothetical protein
MTMPPVGWVYEDDEGRMMFSQMPQNPPLWEPVYKAAPPREWREPTSAETKALWNATKKPSEFAALLLAKTREKNT